MKGEIMVLFALLLRHKCPLACLGMNWEAMCERLLLSHKCLPSDVFTYIPTTDRAIINTFSPWLTADRWMGGCVRLSLTHCGEYPVRGWVRSSYCGEAYPVVQTLATTPPAQLSASHLFHCIQLSLTSKSDFLSLVIYRVSDDQIHY